MHMKDDILSKIIRDRKIRLISEKEADINGVKLLMEERIEIPKLANSFRKAISDAKGMGIIAEVKKGSPSRGIIEQNFDPLKIALEYDAGGADALSVLTEKDHFFGDEKYISVISKEVTRPILRKDFIIDEFQIFEAKIIGASAILLICAALEDHELSAFFRLSKKLELDVLFEVHDEIEVKRAITAGAEIIGVNNRNLKTFITDLQISENLARVIPENCLKISESGIFTKEDSLRLRNCGYKGILVGESLMRSNNRTELIKDLKGLE